MLNDWILTKWTMEMAEQARREEGIWRGGSWRCYQMERDRPVAHSHRPCGSICSQYRGHSRNLSGGEKRQCRSVVLRTQPSHVCSQSWRPVPCWSRRHCSCGHASSRDEIPVSPSLAVTGWATTMAGCSNEWHRGTVRQERADGHDSYPNCLHQRPYWDVIWAW